MLLPRTSLNTWGEKRDTCPQTHPDLIDTALGATSTGGANGGITLTLAEQAGLSAASNCNAWLWNGSNSAQHAPAIPLASSLGHRGNRTENTHSFARPSPDLAAYQEAAASIGNALAARSRKCIDVTQSHSHHPRSTPVLPGWQYQQPPQGVSSGPARSSSDFSPAALLNTSPALLDTRHTYASEGDASSALSYPSCSPSQWGGVTAANSTYRPVDPTLASQALRSTLLRRKNATGLRANNGRRAFVGSLWRAHAYSVPPYSRTPPSHCVATTPAHPQHRPTWGVSKHAFVTVIETQLKPPKNARALSRPQQQTPGRF